MRIDHKIINITKREIYIESKEEFLDFPETDIVIEHSLFSISKWEAKYHKPFLSSEKTQAETLDYIRMMIVGDEPENSEMFFLTLQPEIVKEIKEYIQNPMTATTVPEEESKPGEKKKEEIVTSELIYYWMTTQNIPFDCEMWHINRLIMLIKVCAFKNQPEDKKKRKMTSSDLALRRAKMDAARAKYKKH